MRDIMVRCKRCFRYYNIMKMKECSCCEGPSLLDRRGPHRVPEEDWGKRIQQVVAEWTEPYKQRILELDTKLGAEEQTCDVLRKKIIELEREIKQLLGDRK